MDKNNKIWDANFSINNTKEEIEKLKVLLKEADSECKIQLYSLFLSPKMLKNSVIYFPKEEFKPIEPKPISYNDGIDLMEHIYRNNIEKEKISYIVSDKVAQMFRKIEKPFA